MNAPIFFEILSEGKITLMTREYVVVETSNRFGNPMYNASRNFSGRQILTYDYYLLTENGDISRFLEKRKDLYPYFGNRQDIMKDYIKENKLKVNNQSDLIRIINHFNLLNN
jgi:hypothetical protein